MQVNYTELCLVTEKLRMLWRDSQVSSEKDASTDSDSLPESAVDTTLWAEGVSGNLAGVPCGTLSWLREGQTLEGQAPWTEGGARWAHLGRPLLSHFETKNVPFPTSL